VPLSDPDFGDVRDYMAGEESMAGLLPGSFHDRQRLVHLFDVATRTPGTEGDRTRVRARSSLPASISAWDGSMAGGPPGVPFALFNHSRLNGRGGPAAIRKELHWLEANHQAQHPQEEKHGARRRQKAATKKGAAAPKLKGPREGRPARPEGQGHGARGRKAGPRRSWRRRQTRPPAPPSKPPRPPARRRAPRPPARPASSDSSG